MVKYTKVANNWSIVSNEFTMIKKMVACRFYLDPLRKVNYMFKNTQKVDILGHQP